MVLYKLHAYLIDIISVFLIYERYMVAAMAQFNLRLPEAFDFKNPDDWPRWKRRFEQFRVASGLGEERQVSTLLYCLGEEADAILTSTNPSADNKKKYDSVIEKFNGFFQVRKNVIFERAGFNRRNQQDGKSAENYITTLYELAEYLDYGALKSEMIRDRLVVGIRDGVLSERLQMEADLTLEKAKKMICQREAVHEQQSALKGATEPNIVATINNATTTGGQQGRDSQQPKFRQPPTPIGPRRSCTRCGREAHP